MSTPGCSAKDLTKEKSLWDIYRASRRIPTTAFNKVVTWLVFLLLVLQCWVSEQSVEVTIEVVRHAADTGLVVALSTVGLLLAGFTIFSTVSQPSLSLQMANVLHVESGLSWLKHNYFIFFRIFIYFLIFAVFCFSIIAFGHKGGLVSTLISYSPHHQEMRFLVAKLSYVVIFTSFFFLIIQLKSFIFNIYHAVMTSLRWRAEGYDD